MITNQGILFGTSIAGSDTIMSSIKQSQHTQMTTRRLYSYYPANRMNLLLSIVVTFKHLSSIKEVTHVYLASRVDYISRGGGIIIYYLKKQYESTLYNALPTPSIDYLVQTKPNIICYNILAPQTINYLEENNGRR